MAGMPRGIAWEVPGYYIQHLNPLAAGLYLARNGVAVFGLFHGSSPLGRRPGWFVL